MKRQLKVYCDSSFNKEVIKTNINCSTAFIIVEKNKIIFSKTYSYTNVKDNNNGEMQAIIDALKYLFDNNLINHSIVLSSDSELSVKAIKTVNSNINRHFSNKLASIYNLKLNFSDIVIKYTKRNDYYINICDNLARQKLNKKN